MFAQIFSCKCKLKNNCLISEPPYFLQRPADIVSVAGSDIFLACQVGGDPGPAVKWTRQGKDELPDTIQIIPEQGLSIKNLHPSDQGMYLCHASNKAGSISANAMLRVEEPPVITLNQWHIIKYRLVAK